MKHPAFRQIEHRPWPLPDRPWTLTQRWEDLLFVHWPIAPSAIRDAIPSELEIDLFDGSAWIGLVPFDMKAVTKRGFPAPSALCDFPEINVRTYVSYGGKAGVWFFSLDVPSSLAAWAARTFFHLPYSSATMAVQREKGAIDYRHARGSLAFEGRYGPIGEVESFPSDSFEAWSTERYCLYTVDRKGRLLRGQIQHPKWALQAAELEISRNTLTQAFDLGERHPSLLYSKSIDVVVYPLERV